VPEFEIEPLAGPNAEVRGVLAAGTLLHSYQLISVLGQGGFGVTYLARDTKLDREVAIKEYLPTSLALREDGTMVLPRSLDLAEEFAWGRERFLDEARTLAKLEGAPSIVRVIDFLEANGTAYTVMALIRGETLDRRLRRDRILSPAAVERLLFPLLDGLERVHEIGFLHRDIKPANIVLDRDGAPTLIDFGAARAAMAGRSEPMTAIFTPGYAAAEQFASASQGPWTDIYGLSATLYHAITGRAPPSAFDRVLDDAAQPVASTWLCARAAGGNRCRAGGAVEQPAPQRRRLAADAARHASGTVIQHVHRSLTKVHGWPLFHRSTRRSRAYIGTWEPSGQPSAPAPVGRRGLRADLGRDGRLLRAHAFPGHGRANHDGRGTVVGAGGAAQGRRSGRGEEEA
jgi:serine/threonine protein kinase